MATIDTVISQFNYERKKHTEIDEKQLIEFFKIHALVATAERIGGTLEELHYIRTEIEKMNNHD